MESQDSGMAVRVNPFPERVTVTCEVTIGGIRLATQVTVEKIAYDDPGIARSVRSNLLDAMAEAILKEWPPEIREHR